jgi:hypothetical protein
MLQWRIFAFPEDNFRPRLILIVYLWEDKANNPQGAVVKIVEELPSGLLASRIVSKQSTALGTEMMLGILWPPQVYRKQFGKLPQPKQLRKVTHNGTIHRGIILEPSFGHQHTIPPASHTIRGLTLFNS